MCHRTEERLLIDRDTVEHVARLAQIALSPQEIEEFAVELSSIVAHIDKLSELNTDSVEPTAHASRAGSVMRDDVPVPSWSVERVLANAPHRVGDLFEVQAILE